MQQYQHAQSSVGPFAAHQRLLRERLCVVLTELHPLLRDDVTAALTERGKLLAPDTGNAALPSGVWSLLTMLVAQSIAPNINLATVCNVALAVECYICALDLLDDVEDEDQTPILTMLGSARTLNVSTALLTLSQHLLLSLSKQGEDVQMVQRLLLMLQEATLMATAGQHRDLLAEVRRTDTFTMEECIEIASWKAGMLMRLACRLGAVIARADEVSLQLFSQLGEQLGIAHQLDNDSHDLYYIVQDRFHGDTHKSDLVRQKKTLPVVLAANEYAFHDTRDAPDAPKNADKKNERIDSHSLEQGILAAWGISLLYRQRAEEYLYQLEARHGASALLRVLLLPSAQTNRSTSENVFMGFG